MKKENKRRRERKGKEEIKKDNGKKIRVKRK